ncbi:MAG: hypothetical protein ACYTAN_07975 [Planctomycetota bacterium]
MSTPRSQNRELARLLRELGRARRAFIEATLKLQPESLNHILDESGWTVRRVLEYCRATERRHFTRMFNSFDEEAKVYDSPAASLDHIAPQDPEKTLADECSDIWLAGRETEMWVDVIDGENVDEPRAATDTLPQKGWTIRSVFRRVTVLYREKARTIDGL